MAAQPCGLSATALGLVSVGLLRVPSAPSSRSFMKMLNRVGLVLNPGVTGEFISRYWPPTRLCLLCGDSLWFFISWDIPKSLSSGLFFLTGFGTPESNKIKVCFLMTRLGEDKPLGENKQC